MEVFKREVRNGVIELKVPKVASSKKLAPMGLTA